jgi:hypothetical protein
MRIRQAILLGTVRLLGVPVETISHCCVFVSFVPSPLAQPARQSSALRTAADGTEHPDTVSGCTMPTKHGRHLSRPLQGSQQPLCYRRRALLHRLLAKPLRLISVSHNARVRRYRWQHIVLDEPVAPSWFFCRAGVLAPAIVRVGAETMDCDNAGRSAEGFVQAIVAGERTRCFLFLTVLRGAPLVPGLC